MSETIKHANENNTEATPAEYLTESICRVIEKFMDSGEISLKAQHSGTIYFMCKEIAEAILEEQGAVIVALQWKAEYENFKNKYCPPVEGDISSARGGLELATHFFEPLLAALQQENERLKEAIASWELNMEACVIKNEKWSRWALNRIQYLEKEFEAANKEIIYLQNQLSLNLKSNNMTQEQELLQRAAAEIRQLRSRNQFLETRLSGFDDCLKLLNTEPFRQSQGMSPDVAWEIDKLLSSQLSETKTA